MGNICVSSDATNNTYKSRKSNKSLKKSHDKMVQTNQESLYAPNRPSDAINTFS